MKHIPLFLSVVAVVVAGVALNPQVRADETWNGGNGKWDLNTTPDWNGGSTWTTNSQAAVFNTTPGTVTVDNTDGQVGADYLYFNSSSPSAAWDVAGGALDMSIAGNGNNLVIDQDGNSGNVTINSALNIDTTLSTDRYNIFSNSASSLTLNGNITIGAQTPSTSTARSLIIGSTNNSAVFYLNGTITDSYTTGGVAMQLRLAEGGATEDTYVINGDVSGMHAGVSIGSGNVVVDPTANMGTGTIGMYDDQDNSSENVALYGAQGATISNYIYISMKYHSDGNYGNGTLGNYDATSVLYSGGIGLDNSGITFNTAANGRATFTSDISNHSPNGLIKTGTGTLALNEANGNDFGLYNDFSSTPGTVAMDIQQGTVLINNAQSSAFGNNSGSVKIEAGATLGGNGQTGGTQQVVAESATSVIAPGDAGQANLGIKPSIGKLNLAGGLVAANGLTMDFKLTSGGGTPAPGIDYDQLTGSTFTLNGDVTINFTALDGVATETPYTIIQANTGLNGDPNYIFNAPAGYALDPDYGAARGTDGYVIDPVGGTLTVEFIAVPEPSAYALMGLGLLALAGINRLRRLNGASA